MCTTEEINRFKKITLEVYGIDLSDDDAEDQLNRLMQAVNLLMSDRSMTLTKKAVHIKQLTLRNQKKNRK